MSFTVEKSINYRRKKKNGKTQVQDRSKSAFTTDNLLAIFTEGNILKRTYLKFM